MVLKVQRVPRLPTAERERERGAYLHYGLFLLLLSHLAPTSIVQRQSERVRENERQGRASAVRTGLG